MLDFQEDASWKLLVPHRARSFGLSKVLDFWVKWSQDPGRPQIGLFLGSPFRVPENPCPRTDVRTETMYWCWGGGYWLPLALASQQPAVILHAITRICGST